MIMAGATSSQSPIVAGGGAVIPSIWARNTGKRAEASMSEMGHIATGRAFKNYTAQTSRTFDLRLEKRSMSACASRIRAQWSILLTIRIKESNDWPLALQPLSSG
jgi:hypothetical protein